MYSILNGKEIFMSTKDQNLVESFNNETSIYYPQPFRPYINTILNSDLKVK